MSGTAAWLNYRYRDHTERFTGKFYARLDLPSPKPLMYYSATHVAVSGSLEVIPLETIIITQIKANSVKSETQG